MKTKENHTTLVKEYWLMTRHRGAQVVFRSLIAPVMSRFFEGGASSEGLRSAADKVTGKAQ
jgi:hypothetical protein